TARRRTRRYTPGRFADVLDGTSTTLLVAEKRINLSNLGLGQSGSDDNLGYTAGWDEDTLRRTDKIPLPDYTGTTTPNDLERFGASHPGALNAVFVDGSVRRIAYSIDKPVGATPGDRADGRPFSAGDSYPRRPAGGPARTRIRLHGGDDAGPLAQWTDVGPSDRRAAGRGVRRPGRDRRQAV